jgi:monoterpene epsilon-lactone hydrolase
VPRLVLSLALFACTLAATSLPALAQSDQSAASPAQTAAPSYPTTDTSTVTADGTAHITRVVPLPSILSPQEHAKLAKSGSDTASMEPDVFKRRAMTQAWQNGAGKQSEAVYPVKITETKVAGIPVHLVDPLPDATAGPVSGPGANAPDPLHYSALAGGGNAARPSVPETLHPDRVFLCVHGGGFDSDSGSYSEAIPIANLTRTRVVSVLYRLSPENAFPAALDDAIAVYKELLKTYKPDKIAVYGTSAGAILTGEIAARIKQLRLPEPAALGIFSGFGDYTATGDSGALFTLTGFTGPLVAPKPDTPHILPTYVGSLSPSDPVLSPNLGDLHGLPPTLFLTSSRDLLLSGTADMQRAWARDGVPTQMTVFDGLSHAFWLDIDMPESREAYATMARFFLQNMK